MSASDTEDSSQNGGGDNTSTTTADSVSTSESQPHEGTSNSHQPKRRKVLLPQNSDHHKGDGTTIRQQQPDSHHDDQEEEELEDTESDDDVDDDDDDDDETSSVIVEEQPHETNTNQSKTTKSSTSSAAGAAPLLDNHHHSPTTTEINGKKKKTKSIGVPSPPPRAESSLMTKAVHNIKSQPPSSPKLTTTSRSGEAEVEATPLDDASPTSPTTTTTNNNKSKEKNKARTTMILRLGTDYEPRSTDVICQRGRTAYEHSGNQRFRGMIAQDLATYEQAASKASKSSIVTNVLERIQCGTPAGAFIRQVDETDSSEQQQQQHPQQQQGPSSPSSSSANKSSKVVCWYVVEDAIAREKIGQAFRDSLHLKYRSSSKAKKSRMKDANDTTSKRSNNPKNDSSDTREHHENKSYDHEGSSVSSPLTPPRSTAAATAGSQQIIHSDTSLAISALVHLASAAQAIPRLPTSNVTSSNANNASAAESSSDVEGQKRAFTGKVGSRLDGDPGSTDVICGRGKRAYDHKGNARFRKLISKEMERYEKSVSKVEKSSIVSDIIFRVRGASPPGSFVREDTDQPGTWLEVGDAVAREKIGQSFRDLLHTKYSSSTKAKKRKRSANLKNGTNQPEQSGVPPNVKIPITDGDKRQKTASKPSNNQDDQTLSERSSNVSGDEQHSGKLEEWLTNIALVGCSSAPGKQRIQTYAQHFLELGLHSAEMIQQWCTKADVQTFYWMKKFHKRVFLQNAGLQQ
eukprot:CAMPEP_0168734116 /NCGR_PEP_ID=MMETSP0724-20121128/8644_1 /TAXON_ID=265536 /ORGANISM="Amphiprora sp., Strain CCMP467" /LENGTH=743 /DNA_ID=CAMNT_0008781203 /DNA_START=145 /DNA_END=2376 /DNA_ORIENTATION=+